jgi:hypothetical protein
MKNLSLAFAAAVLAVLAGCTATTTQPDVGVSSEALTLAQCSTQRDACFAKNGLFGLLTCNAQYTTCSATATNGLPAQVVDAAAAAAECTTDLDDCVLAATKPSDLAVCAEAQAACAADVLEITLPELDLSLPPVVSGTTDCADAALACVQDAATVADLTACAEELTGCTLEVVDQGGAISDVVECTLSLDDCVAAASTPTALTACGEEQALCVAAALEVELPAVPVSDVVNCAEEAADCTLGAESISDVLGCTEDLVACGEAVLDSTGVPAAVDCNAQWTVCMFTNPFGFKKCGDALRICQM